MPQESCTGSFARNVLHGILHGILHWILPWILHGVGGGWTVNRHRRGAPHVGKSSRFSLDVNRQIKAPARTKAKGLSASEAWMEARGRWKAAKGYGIGAWGWRGGWDARTGGGARERRTHRRSRRALVPASMTEKRQVTSTPVVPGPSRSWNPARRFTCTMPVMTLMMMFSSHMPTLAEPLAPLALACAS